MSDFPLDPEPFDPPVLYCRHLLVGRGMWYGSSKPDDGLSLHRIVVDIRNPDGSADPFVVPQLFAYCQLVGAVGVYNVFVTLVEVVTDEHGDEFAQPVMAWGPRVASVSGLELAETQVLPLDRVPFNGPGLYEFQLCEFGADELLAAERVRVPDVIEELP